MKTYLQNPCEWIIPILAVIGTIFVYPGCLIFAFGFVEIIVSDVIK